MFEKDVAVLGFNCKVAHFHTVLRHIEKLFTVLSLVIQDIFILWSTDHPSECSGCLVEIGFGYDERLSGSSLLCSILIADTLTSVRKFCSGPFTDTRHKVYSIVYDGLRNLAGILSTR